MHILSSPMDKRVRIATDLPHPAKSSSHDSTAQPLPSQSARVGDDATTHEMLLPFVDRPIEVEELLFQTPCNARLAHRINALIDTRGAAGRELQHLLVETTREELADLKWVKRLRSVVDALKPGLWSELEHTLGAEGLSTREETPGDARSPAVAFKPDGIASRQSSRQSSHEGSLPPLSWSHRRQPSDEGSKTYTTSKPSAFQTTSTTANRTSTHVQGHRHQPSFSPESSRGQDGGAVPSVAPTHVSLERIKSAPIRRGSSNHAAGTSTPSAEKQLRNARPLGTPSVDDAELLSPQKSKYSFARTFEGPTLANARTGLRPKAYSMTQYSSNVEQFRLDLGREGDISPCEIAAELEEKGEEKPPSLGVLDDGRTKHPFAGQHKNPLAVAAMHPAVGLTPATKTKRTSSSSNSGSEGDGDGENENDSSASASPSSSSQRPTPRSSLAEKSEPTPSNLPIPPAVESLPQLKIPSDSQPIPPSPSSPSSKLRSSGGSGFALGGGFFKQRPTSLHQRRATEGSPTTPSSSGERKEVTWSPQIYRRPGGFASFSRDLVATKRQGRSRSESAASAISSGSQAIASSEGTPFPDYVASSDDDTDDEQSLVGDRAGVSTPAARRSTQRPAGDLGLDFGDGNNEDSPDGTSTAASPTSPVAWPSPPREATLSPRGLRGSDHIIIPVSPGAERSRSEVMDSLLRNEKFAAISQSMTSAIGAPSWDHARSFLSHADRRHVNDKQLLEYLAKECFGLVDLDSTNSAERQKAEEVVCEDFEAYTTRWTAFKELLQALGVPQSSIEEAQRRCAPGNNLY